VVCSVSSVCTSGGSLASWDPSLFDLTPFLTVGGILLTGRIFLNNREVALLNVYTPCTNQLSLWQSVESSGLLDVRNLIMVGNFNILLSLEEAWGGNKIGLVDDYYIDLFTSKHLIDIKPSKLVPT